MGHTFFSSARLASLRLEPSRPGGELGDMDHLSASTSLLYAVSGMLFLSSRMNSEAHNSLSLMLPWASHLGGL